MVGQGVYTLAEVSRYTKVPEATVRKWFRSRSDRRRHQPVFDSDYPAIDGDYAVSFLNLIEAHVAAFFRSKGVSVEITRKAHQKLRRELRIDHPFAHTDLCTDGRRIIIEKVHELADAINKQLFFTEMRHRLSRIEYGQSGLAEVWQIADGVQVNPKVGFGKPVIKNTGIATAIIARQYEANQRNESLVAKLYRIEQADVMNAVHFEHSIRHAA